jgi:regulator of protease activity HflC (stomatin/prohibitin superfamily)
VNIAGLFQAIASFAWLGFIGLLVLMFVRMGRGQPTRALSTTVLVLLVVALLLSTVGLGLVFVEPDEIGIVVTILGSGGIRPDPLPSGLHWVIPVAERVERNSIRNQTYTMTSAATEGQVTGDDSIQVRTKDGQQVSIDASVIYAIDQTKAVPLLQDVGLQL